MILEAFHYEDYPGGALVAALAYRTGLHNLGFDNDSVHASVHATDSPAQSQYGNAPPRRGVEAIPTHTRLRSKTCSKQR